MIYIILGMHKSGTTLISKILHESGINMGNFDSSISYDSGNQYERNEFQAINKEILECGNAHSLNVVKPLTLNYNNSDMAMKIAKLSAELSSCHQNWGFKDPRTCLTYSFWKKHLPEHKVIFVYRSPQEVWHHYKKHTPIYKFLLRLPAGCKTLNAWYIYNQQILEFIRHKGGYVIEYSEFMKTPNAIEKLSAFVKIPLIDFREKSLYRAKNKSEISYKFCSYIEKKLFNQDIDNTFIELQELKKK